MAEDPSSGERSGDIESRGAEPTPPEVLPIATAENKQQLGKLIRGLLASGALALFLGAIWAYFSVAGLIYMPAARIILVFAWCAGVAGIVVSEYIWGRSLRHKVRLGIGAAAILAMFLIGLDAWTVRHLSPPPITGADVPRIAREVAKLLGQPINMATYESHPNGLVHTEGIVTDARIGTPVSGANVGLQNLQNNLFHAYTKTDANGNFGFDALPLAYDFRITVTKSDYQDAAIPYNRGVKNVAIQLQRVSVPKGPRYPAQQGTATKLGDLLVESNAVLDACKTGPTPQCAEEKGRWEKGVEAALKSEPSERARWLIVVHQNQMGFPYAAVANEANALSALIGPGQPIPVPRGEPVQPSTIPSEAERIVLSRALANGTGTVVIVAVGNTIANTVADMIASAFGDAKQNGDPKWSVQRSSLGALNVTTIGGRIDFEGIYFVARDSSSPEAKTIIAAFEQARHPVSSSASLRPRGDLTIYVVYGNPR